VPTDPKAMALDAAAPMPRGCQECGERFEPRRPGPEVLQPAMPAAGARREAEARGSCQRPGAGGAARPFPGDDELIEELAERIAREVEARPPACAWCVKTLANGALFCSDVCSESYAQKLMPTPFARSRYGSIIPDAARIMKRRRDMARAAAWRAEHGR
jgi:hypothetical protein